MRSPEAIKESHIIGAEYTPSTGGEGFVLGCVANNPDGYVYKAHPQIRSFRNSHESLMRHNYICVYPKESKFDQLYLRLKSC